MNIDLRLAIYERRFADASVLVGKIKAEIQRNKPLAFTRK
jgi:hypothetical protein